MRMKAISKLCRRSKRAVLYNQADGSGEIVRQYIGDDASIYPLDGLPLLDTENIPVLLGIEKKDKEKWIIRQQMIPEGISLKDYEPGEIQLEYCGITIDCGKKVTAMRAGQGVVWMDEAYLDPVEAENGMLMLFFRSTGSGSRYIVVKRGLELAGLVFPYMAKEFEERILKLAECLKYCPGTEESLAFGQMELDTLKNGEE